MTNPKITTLIAAEAVQASVRQLAGRIGAAYRESRAVQVVALLEGARRFATDLLGCLDDPKYTLSTITASSYNGGTHSTGQVRITAQTPLALNGREVLLVDDIYDTGNTLTATIDWLKRHGAGPIRTAVLLVKKRGHERPVPIDFFALAVEDLFVVGYGLDYQGHYRDLDYIGLLEPDTDTPLP